MAERGLFRVLHRWSALVSLAVGDRPLEPIEHLLEQRDRHLEDYLLGGTTEWTAYTPTWVSTGTQPALDDGAIVGAYRLLGKTVEVRIYLVMGSTTTYGTGYYKFGLPASLSVPAGTVQTVSAWMHNAGVAYYPQLAVIGVSPINALTEFVVVASALNVMDATNPFTWGNGDELVIQGVIEVA